MNKGASEYTLSSHTTGGEGKKEIMEVKTGWINSVGETMAAGKNPKA